MIELKIDELISALNANTEALLGRGQTPLAATVETPKKSSKKAAAVVEVVTPTEPVTPPAPPADAPVTPPAAPEPEKPAEPAEPTIQDLRSAAQAFLDAGGDRTKLIEINTKLGQKKIGDTAPDKIAAVLADIKAMTPTPKA